MAKLQGAVIYNENDLAINRSYADWLVEEAESLDMDLQVMTREDMDISYNVTDVSDTAGIHQHHERLVLSSGVPNDSETVIKSGITHGITSGITPDFVINRSRDANLTRFFEMSGVRVFNNSIITDLGNRKELAYAHAKKCGVPILPFELHHQSKAKTHELVRIFKTPTGHGGNEIHAGKSYIPGGVFESIEGEPLLPKDDLVLSQEFCNGLTGDLRVYIMDNRPYAAVMRHTPEGSYLSNFTKGASIGFFEIEKTPVAAYVDALLKDVHVDYCGLDFLCDAQGKFFFNELEDAVGSRMLSQLGAGHNTAGDLMKHIRACMDR